MPSGIVTEVGREDWQTLLLNADLSIMHRTAGACNLVDNMAARTMMISMTGRLTFPQAIIPDAAGEAACQLVNSPSPSRIRPSMHVQDALPYRDVLCNAEALLRAECSPDGNHGKLGMKLLEGSIHAVACIALPIVLQGDGFMWWLLPLPVLKVRQWVVIITILQQFQATDQGR